MHTDVERLVETAEHTDLGKLGHSGQKYKLKMLVSAFEYGVETFQDITVLFLKTCIYIEHIQDRLVIFINQHHSTETSLFMNVFQNLNETQAQRKFPIGFKMKLTFPWSDIAPYPLLQYSFFRKISTVKIDMEYRIDLPVLFQTVYLQSSEQFLPAEKIVLQSRNKKTLTKTSGTAQKVYGALIDKRVNQIGLVNINITVFYYSVETLYSYRIFHTIEFLKFVFTFSYKGRKNIRKVAFILDC